jgi:hypothetical protein
MSRVTRRIRYAHWSLAGRLGAAPAFNLPAKVTVLITYFHPARMQHIEAQVRNLLRCNFVEQIVLSNHNPQVRIEEQIKLRDPCLRFLNQPVARGCGYRWLVANEIDPAYLIVIDDDLLLYPTQLAQLFQALLRTPEVPHGFSGMRVTDAGRFEYQEHREATVDYLCEIYAVTRQHLQRYLALRDQIATDTTVGEMIDSAVDFMLISQSGAGAPQIHNAGRLLRCETFQREGVAVHKHNGFAERMWVIQQALSDAGQSAVAAPVEVIQR